MAILIVCAVAGLLIGSFLSVVIDRYKKPMTIVIGRSQCPHCHHQLSALELVPLVSYVVLQGKCKNCHQSISLRYPFLEIASASLAVLMVSQYGLSWLALAYFIVFSLLLAAAMIDLTEYIVPDWLVLPAILIAYAALALRLDFSNYDPFWGVLVAGGPLAALVIVSNEQWMGAGDIGLGVILGLVGGLTGGILGLILAFIGGALISLFLLLVRRKKIKDTVPFGPFLALASLVVAVWGNSLTSWYLHLIGF